MSGEVSAVSWEKAAINSEYGKLELPGSIHIDEIRLVDEARAQGDLPMRFTWIMTTVKPGDDIGMGRIVHYDLGDPERKRACEPTQDVLCWKYQGLEELPPGHIFTVSHYQSIVTCQECKELIHS